MDVSVKKLSEILKIDPNALLKKMIEAGLPHTSIEDSVSNDDKQILLSFIRTANSNVQSAEKKPIEVTPKPPSEPKDLEKKNKQPPVAISKAKNKKPSQPKIKQEPKEEKKKSVNINGSIRVNDLSRKLSKRGNEVVKKLIELGEMVSLNDEIDQETAVLVAEEFGFVVKYESEQELEEITKDYPKPSITYKDESSPIKRHPVVTVMGHVDHGKTSLLDSIKSSNVVDGESGGITQHIAAYEVKTSSAVITFIDTPGHEAFTAMRARGANTTDIVILVVAANDSVKPQTVEAITHAKAAQVPIIVAINKIDLDGADVDKVKGDLAKHDLVSEDWGGKVQMIPVSATQKKGIDELLDAIQLEAEILELKSPINGLATGVILESKLDKSKGPLGTFLIQKGILRQGDIVVAAEKRGRIKTLVNSSGDFIKEAGPSTPVEVLGLEDCVPAGESFYVLANDKAARSLVDERISYLKEINDKNVMTTESAFEMLDQEKINKLRIIVKSDVAGTSEAIIGSLLKVGNEEVEVDIVSSGVGGITESDVNLAITTGARILGFNVRADNKTKSLAEEKSIEINYYSVIYNLLEDIKRLLSGLLDPIYSEKILGLAEVKEVFKSPKFGQVAGCMVIDGFVKREKHVRVLRDNVVIHEGELDSLRRFKDDVQEVKNGTECGIGIKNYLDIRPGDVIENFEQKEEKRSL
ncbi:MAG: translation initiation factor IF-2 [SAR86 cluster bacterium]|nr:translation initiation factor IF-2 [SAR86 cluster bacterium]MDA0899883.1 translation initiation factor IF-2 [Pseudomonadota bacterium]MDA1056748.1 translation initiation factor IF-2 [Pseudomonadota bacterium]